MHTQFWMIKKETISPAHRFPLHYIIVSLDLKSDRTLLERLKKKGYTFKTQFTNVFTHFQA